MAEEPFAQFEQNPSVQPSDTVYIRSRETDLARCSDKMTKADERIALEDCKSQMYKVAFTECMRATFMALWK